MRGAAPSQSGRMLNTPAALREADLPNLKLYSIALVAALGLAFLGLFSLSTPRTPRLVESPSSFDSARAFSDIQTLSVDYTGRTAGSSKDSLSAVWLTQALTKIGLDPHIESFAASINGNQ